MLNKCNKRLIKDLIDDAVQYSSCEKPNNSCIWSHLMDQEDCLPNHAIKLNGRHLSEQFMRCLLSNDVSTDLINAISLEQVTFSQEADFKTVRILLNHLFRYRVSAKIPTQVSCTKLVFLFFHPLKVRLIAGDGHFFATSSMPDNNRTNSPTIRCKFIPTPSLDQLAITGLSNGSDCVCFSMSNSRRLTSTGDFRSQTGVSDGS